MKIRFKKLNPKAVMPRKAHPSDAGFDLTCTSVEKQGKCYVCGTGLAVEIPEGCVGLVFPRSSISKTDFILVNGVGVIDSCFRGEITFKFKYIGPFVTESSDDYSNIYSVGDRIGQLIIIPYPEVEFEEAESLTETDRGVGGYGSTGR